MDGATLMVIIAVVLAGVALVIVFLLASHVRRLEYEIQQLTDVDPRDSPFTAELVRRQRELKRDVERRLLDNPYPDDWEDYDRPAFLRRQAD